MQVKQMFTGYPMGFKQMNAQTIQPQQQEHKPSFWEKLWGGVKTVGGALLGSPGGQAILGKAKDFVGEKINSYGGTLMNKLGMK